MSCQPTMATPSAVANNSKTCKSCDFSTDCPKRQAGDPCPYCYVETARKNNFNAKKIYETEYRGEVKNFRPATIEKLNSGGGLRLFSFGDYMRKHDAYILRFLDDCYSVGLRVKVITKQRAFIRKFHDHKAIRVIHLSVDSVGSGVPLRSAIDYRRKYAKVLVRCVCLSMADVERYGRNNRIDIITLNHGANGFEQFKGAKRTTIENRFPGRVCCATGKCESCHIACGDPSTK